VLPQREYDDRRCEIALGDIVAFWTDGVTERRHRSAMFGEERLLSLLTGLANRPASDVAREIDDAVMNFAPGLPGDDVAILIARVTGTTLTLEGTTDPRLARGLARLDG
jgi:serine phosphatase RsbU (regulator of sigma subunit)